LDIIIRIDAAQVTGAKAFSNACHNALRLDKECAIQILRMAPLPRGKGHRWVLKHLVVIPAPWAEVKAAGEACPVKFIGAVIKANSIGQAQEFKSVVGQSPSPPPLPSTPPNDGTKACPYCGEEIKQVAIICRFCGTHLASGETIGAQAHGVRSAGPVQVAERILWQDNPTHWAYLGVYVLTAILIPVVIGIPLLIWAILDRKHTVYTLTNKRVTQKRGIIGKDLSEVDLKDIRNVLVKYGVLDRILGIGNIGVGTAAQAGIEIKMNGCRNPERVRQLIVDAKDRARELSY